MLVLASACCERKSDPPGHSSGPAAKKAASAASPIDELGIDLETLPWMPMRARTPRDGFVATKSHVSVKPPISLKSSVLSGRHNEVAWLDATRLRLLGALEWLEVDVVSGQVASARLPSPTGDSRMLCLSADGKTAVSGNAIYRGWPDPRKVATIPGADANASCALDADGAVVATVQRGGLAVWRIGPDGSVSPLASRRFAAPDRFARKPIMHPSAEWLLLRGVGSVEQIDTASGKTMAEIEITGLESGSMARGVLGGGDHQLYVQSTKKTLHARRLPGGQVIAGWRSAPDATFAVAARRDAVFALSPSGLTRWSLPEMRPEAGELASATPVPSSGRLTVGPRYGVLISERGLHVFDSETLSWTRTHQLPLLAGGYHKVKRVTDKGTVVVEATRGPCVYSTDPSSSARVELVGCGRRTPDIERTCRVAPRPGEQEINTFVGTAQARWVVPDGGPDLVWAVVDRVCAGRSEHSLVRFDEGLRIVGRVALERVVVEPGDGYSWSAVRLAASQSPTGAWYLSTLLTAERGVAWNTADGSIAFERKFADPVHIRRYEAQVGKNGLEAVPFFPLAIPPGGNEHLLQELGGHRAWVWTDKRNRTLMRAESIDAPKASAIRAADGRKIKPMVFSGDDRYLLVSAHHVGSDVGTWGLDARNGKDLWFDARISSAAARISRYEVVVADWKRHDLVRVLDLRTGEQTRTAAVEPTDDGIASTRIAEVYPLDARGRSLFAIRESGQAHLVRVKE